MNCLAAAIHFSSVIGGSCFWQKMVSIFDRQ
jgi:hypothetical protein